MIEKRMTWILPKTKSNCERTSVAVCYVNLFFNEIYSATYFYQIKWKLFSSLITSVSWKLIQFSGYYCLLYNLTFFRIWLWYCGNSFVLSWVYLNHQSFLKGFALIERLTCRQVKPPIFNHLSTLKQILCFYKCQFSLCLLLPISCLWMLRWLQSIPSPASNWSKHLEKPDFLLLLAG